jgi:putative ABC transport system substrate-binding protein
MKTKAFVLPIAMLAIAALAGCNSGSSTEVKIGILQLVSATPLNAVNDNFQSTILASDWAKTHTPVFTVQDPQLDEATMATMATNLVANSSLVLGIATGASQALKSAASKAGSSIPILFSAVTDPVGANLVATTTAAPGGNVSGCSDMGPVDESMQLINTHFSTIKKTVAVIYNTGESNSVQQITIAKAALGALGWSVLDKAVAAETEITSSLDTIPDDVKMLYFPTDNMCASNASAIAKFAKERQIFVCCGDSSLVSADDALFSLGVDYSNLGTQVGEMALQILSGEKTVGELPVGFATNFPLVVNERAAEAWGVTLPASLIAAANEVISNEQSTSSASV